MEQVVTSFGFKVLAFLCAFAFADFSITRTLRYYYDNCPSGNVRELNYVIEYSNEDIILMGSSRARHHLIPSIFRDSLGLTTYNAGMDGQGIIYHYCILSALINRRPPSVVVLDLTDADFTLSNSFGLEQLSALAPYYGLGAGIDSVLVLSSWAQRIKLQFGLYRFNSKISDILAGYIGNSSIEDGYLPLLGHNSMKLKKMPTGNPALDGLKIMYYRKFLSLATSKGITVVITVSPFFMLLDENARWLETLKAVAAEYDVKVCDFSNYPFFLKRPELFKDLRHLNHDGATMFSGLVEKQVETEIESPNDLAIND